MISVEDKKGDVLKSGKVKLSKPEIKVGIGMEAKVEDPKLKVSIGKIRIKPGKAKVVKLPGKIIKMKDLISLQYKDPIHDVAEIPKFGLYASKK